MWQLDTLPPLLGEEADDTKSVFSSYDKECQVPFEEDENHARVPGTRRFPSRCGWLFWWRGTSRGIWPHERSRFAHLACKHYVRWSRCESPVFVWKISAKNDKNVEGHLLKSSLLLDNFAPSPQTNTYCRSTSDTDLIPELWAIKSTAWMAKTVIV